MPADQLISFGPYQLDRASGRLLRGGTNVPLRRKTFAVLEYLATRPGCLVAKHELQPESDLIVIYDELDLPLGMIRIRQRGSSAGHNGMESLIGALGTQEFLRIRLGIAPDRKISDGVKYVLTPFRKKELKVVDEVLDTAAEAVSIILKEGPAAAMNRFNRKNEIDDEPRNPRPDLEK